MAVLHMYIGNTHAVREQTWIESMHAHGHHSKQEPWMQHANELVGRCIEKRRPSCSLQPCSKRPRVLRVEQELVAVFCGQMLLCILWTSMQIPSVDLPKMSQ
eukprot:3701626-Amphidinium_carterae.2